ncbi:spore Coat Protein U domain protein [Rickettsia hoogstraalii str. RCCE3]|nr:spore Coat Protein U domain protein [Rickettsia hoogstraalii str. RCCE3]
MQMKTLLYEYQIVIVRRCCCVNLFIRHCERLQGAWQSQDFSTRLLRQLLRNFLAMTMMLIIPGNATALLATCNPSVPTVNFGTFNAGAVRTTSVTASVTCSALLSLLVSYTVTFSTGSANIYNPRNMVNGVGKLNYNLYKDAAFTQILGNGTSSTVTFTDKLYVRSWTGHKKLYRICTPAVTTSCRCWDVSRHYYRNRNPTIAI